MFPELKNRDFTDPKKFEGLDFDYYPHHTKYGDGTEIDYDIIKYLREKLWKNCVGVMAEKGDLVIVDNYLAGHGRLGFTPPRKAFISIITSWKNKVRNEYYINSKNYKLLYLFFAFMYKYI